MPDMPDKLRRLLRRDPVDAALDALAVSLSDRAAYQPTRWAIVSFTLETGAACTERIPHVLEAVDIQGLRGLADNLRSRSGVRAVRLERAGVGVGASALGF